jgi:hypothetical protein
MAVCPNGHDSASDDFCDICGMRMAAPAPAAAGQPPTGSSPAASPSSAWPDVAPASPAYTAEPCPRCGTPRTGQFCEACGFNFAGPRFTPSPPPPTAPPPASGGYSTSQRGPDSYSSSQPGPDSYSQPGSRHASPGADYGSGGYSSPQPPPPAPSIPPTSVAAPVTPGPPPTAPPAAPPTETAPAASPGPPSMSSFPYPQATWTAVVGADRAYYDRVQALTGPEGAAVAFPSYCAERRFQLVGNQMRIGRRSVSRGLSPEIDLTGPPADPGISRLHAVLVSTPDGNWAVLDPGSANGTLVNGAEIGVGDQVPLHDGDRINLGAWTAITVHRGLGNSLRRVGRWRATTSDSRH